MLEGFTENEVLCLTRAFSVDVEALAGHLFVTVSAWVK